MTALLRSLDSRGGDACGLLTVSAGGRIDVQKAVCDAKEFNAYRNPVAPGTRALAVHTRLATQGPQSFNRNNHPVISGMAYVVHNGIVWDDQIRRKQGQPEVDTFALALAADSVSRRLKGEAPLAHAMRVAEACAELEGSHAVGVAYRSQAFLVTARLSQSPLYVGEAEGVRICASTLHAVGEAFDALGIELPMRETTVSNGKKGKKLKTWVEMRECIDWCEEGYVSCWDAGMLSSGKVDVPDHWSGYRYSDSGYSYVKPYASGEGWSTDDVDSLDAIARRVLDANLSPELRNASRSDEIEWARCETCDSYHWDTNLLDRWDMRICHECEAAFVASGATVDEEVQA